MKEPTVKLKLSCARALSAWMDNESNYTPTTKAAETALKLAVEAADRLAERKMALAPKQKHEKPSRLDRLRKAHVKRGAKARKTMNVYDKVLERAHGRCECGCFRRFGDGPDLYAAPEMDDFFGGAHHRNERECWMLRAECHRAKTANRPNRNDWLGRFMTHCRLHGFEQERLRADALVEADALIARAAEASRG